MLPQNLVWIGARLLLWVFPAAYVLNLVFLASDLPQYDYWANLLILFTEDGSGELKPVSEWLLPHNGHPLLLPRLIYLLNIYLSGGSGFYLSLTAFFMGLLQVALLWRAVPEELKNDSFTHLAALADVSILTFTPQAIHNWLLGMSGVAWITTNVLAISSLLCVSRFLDGRRMGWLALGILSSIVSALSYGSGLVVLPLLLLMILASRKTNRAIPLSVMLVSVVALCVYAAHNLFVVRRSTDYEIVQLGVFFNNVLGSIWFQTEELCQVAGILGVILFSYYLFHYRTVAMRTRRQNISFWYAIGLYGIMNVAAMMITRTDQDAAGMAVSRYASIPSLFWLAVLILTLVCYLKWPSFTKLRTTFMIVITTAFMMTYLMSRFERDFRHGPKEESLAAISMRLGSPDKPVVSRWVHPNPLYIARLLPLLRKIRHYPFNERFRFDCGLLGKSIDESLVVETRKDVGPVWGTVDGVRIVGEGTVATVGRIYVKGAEVECLILGGEEGRVEGAGIHNYLRPRPPDRIRHGAVGSLWRGYVRGYRKDHVVQVWVKLRDDDRFHLLYKNVVHKREKTARAVEPAGVPGLARMYREVASRHDPGDTIDSLF